MTDSGEQDPRDPQDPLEEFLSGIRQDIQSGFATLAEAIEQNTNTVSRMADMQCRAYGTLTEIAHLMASEDINAGMAVQILKRAFKADDATIALLARERLGSEHGRGLIAMLAALEHILVESRNLYREEEKEPTRADEMVRLHRTITGKDDKARR